MMNKTGILTLLFSLMCTTPLWADAWDPPAAYYDDATGSGETLQEQLQWIMLSGQIQRSYGQFRYSSAITDQDPDDPNNILLCYNRASVDSAWDSGSTWNREHVWPQSRQSGSASNSTKGNLGDPHALKPCNPSINSSRSNKPFGGADLTGSYCHNGSYYFPGDTEKGDIARALFYSSTRYGTSSNLILVDGFPSGNKMGDLASLLRWHYMDPPDTFERRRNHTIYSQAYNKSYYTNNRNAYIDRPEFVWSVFGGDDNDTMLYVGSEYNSDGSSSITVDLGAVSLGSDNTFAKASVVLHKIGDNGTYYDITPSDNATCSDIPSGQSFDYDSQEITLTIGVAAVPTESGCFVDTVIIDNLDVCGNSPDARGSNDGDDVITILYTVLAADLSGDGHVNMEDLLELMSGWLTVSPELNIVDADEEEPGTINLLDFVVLAGEWEDGSSL